MEGFSLQVWFATFAFPDDIVLMYLVNVYFTIREKWKSLSNNWQYTFGQDSIWESQTFCLDAESDSMKFAFHER